MVHKMHIYFNLISPIWFQHDFTCWIQRQIWGAWRAPILLSEFENFVNGIFIPVQAPNLPSSNPSSLDLPSILSSLAILTAVLSTAFCPPVFCPCVAYVISHYEMSKYEISIPLTTPPPLLPDNPCICLWNLIKTICKFTSILTRFHPLYST